MEQPSERGEFADWLREFRAHTKQSQSQLAKAMGFTKKTITAWETGRHYPDWSVRSLLNEWARQISFRAVPPKRYG